MANEQSKLMKKLQAASFALVEANLYLDTHPTCKEGLEYFRRHKEAYEKVLKEYEERFGPITANAADGTKKWEWVTMPFPWEYQADLRQEHKSKAKEGSDD